MTWELPITVFVSSLGIGLAALIIQDYPLVSILLIVGSWLGLLVVLTWLEKREGRSLKGLSEKD